MPDNPLALADARYAGLPPSLHLLRGPDGRPIDTPAAWEARRPAILDTLLREVYGAPPPPPDVDVVLRRDDSVMDGRAVRRVFDVILTRAAGGTTRRLVFPLMLFLPTTRPAPAPVFLLIHNRSPRLIDPDRTAWDEFWPVDDAITRGYGMAAFSHARVAPDAPGDFRDAPPDAHGHVPSVHALYPDLPRDDNAWGTLAAWAWGASRAMDALARDQDVDVRRVAVAGHSRGGKAALLAAALDGRFAMAVSNDSGCGGAAFTRRARGETIREINTRFPFWFNGNFKRYNDRDAEMPFDQHFLTASIAPRAVYVASAADDEWADPEGEFLTLRMSEPVFALYGLGGLGDASPTLDVPLVGRSMGYHVRPGGHDMLRTDWHRFMDFADHQGWNIDA